MIMIVMMMRARSVLSSLGRGGDPPTSLRWRAQLYFVLSGALVGIERGVRSK